MKAFYYLKGLTVLVFIILIPVIGYSYWRVGWMEDQDQLEILRQEVKRLQEYLLKGEKEYDDFRQRAQPYRDFVEAWSESAQLVEPGRIFQEVDQLAFSLGLATHRKGTSQQSHAGGSLGYRRSNHLTLVVTGDYFSALKFLKTFASRLAWIRADRIRVSPAGGTNVDVQLQLSVPLLADQRDIISRPLPSVAQDPKTQR